MKMQQTENRVSRRLAPLLVGAASAASLVMYLTRRKTFHFRGRIVLITGGSRGLGLVLGRELALAGASLAICARDREELSRAADELRELGAQVLELVCDVRKDTEVQQAVRMCVAEYGAIDCLINNAGVIQVGPLEAQTEEDFREAMDTHFWGAYYFIQAVLPHMRSAGGGRIANIASIGGKVAVPHLAPYCASKFALVGLSAAMRAELAKDDILVTTICPGLMRTGSHINAKFKGEQAAEFALFSIVNALPISSVSAERAARQIIRAIERGDAELIISPQAKLAATINANFPELSASVLETANRFLPGSASGKTDTKTGLESTSMVSPSFVTANIDDAAENNNELKPGEEIA